MRTLTKVFSKIPPQKPFIDMSSLPPSDVLAVAADSVSCVKGYKSGSIFTSWHTSFRTEAVKSLISLWRIMGNAPLEQESMLN